MSQTFESRPAPFPETALLLSPVDQKLDEGFNHYLSQNSELSLDTVTTKESLEFADTVHAFGSRIVNRRIFIIKNGGQRLPDELGEIQPADAAEQTRRLLDSGQSVEAVRPDGKLVRLSSFPSAVIARYMKEFIREYGSDSLDLSAIKRDKRAAALLAAQSSLFPDSTTFTLASHTYDPLRQIQLSDRASMYPEVAMYATLRTIYNTRGQSVAADSIDVLLAACGTRLDNMAAQRDLRWGEAIITQMDGIDQQAS